MEVDLETSIIM